MSRDPSLPMTLGELLMAATNADWQQVVLNGGPPCFHFEPDRQRFCLRAYRWAGHGVDHPFTALADVIGAASLIGDVRTLAPEEIQEDQARLAPSERVSESAQRGDDRGE